MLVLFGCGEGLVAAKCDAVMNPHVSTTGGEFLDKLSAYSLFCTVLQLADIYYHRCHTVIMMMGDSPLKSQSRKTRTRKRECSEERYAYCRMGNKKFATPNFLRFAR